MPKYSYKALNDQGRTVSGVLDAESEAEANESIGDRGLIPSELAEEAESSAAFNMESLTLKLTKVHAQDLILFTKQFSTMLRAGVPMLRSLEILEDQCENKKLKMVAGQVSLDIRHGSNLSEALRKHPKVFSELYCSMISAGELSGALPQTMDRLIYVIEHDQKIKGDISSALQYPMLVVIALSVAFVFLLTGVVPKFAKIFERAGLELPFPTRVCLALSGFLLEYWYLVLGAIVGIAVGLVFYLKTEKGQYTRDLIAMKVPVIGPLLVKAAISRFASIFAILQSTGVAILSSMEILAGTIGNAAIARELAVVSERLEEGRGIAEPLKSARYFTPMLVNMVAIGEESGSLDEMLKEVSNHYDTEVEFAMKKMAEAIGPALLVVLAGVVGFFALAIFMPMWDLTQMVKR